MSLAEFKGQFAQKPQAVQDRLAVAEAFFRKHFPHANDDQLASELRCIDYSKPVSVVSIPATTQLIGYKDPRVSPLRGTYFSKPGNPLERLGIAPIGNLRTSARILDKAYNRYEVRVTVPEALESIAAPAADTWSVKGARILSDGGGTQYVIPQPQRYLTYTTPFPR
jgi:hypothetical protein